MVIKMHERFDSHETFDPISGRNDSAIMRYILDGSNDESAIRNSLENNAPTTYGDLVVQSYRIEPIGPSLWEAEVQYGAPDDLKSQKDKQTNDAEYDFDTTGGSVHITQSLETRGKYSNHPNGAEDYGGAIGVNSNGDVEGVDIVIPSLRFAITGYLPGATVTTAYIKTLARITGKTNDAPFEGFAAGELLFMGATGKKRGRGDWEIRFNFDASENQAGLVIAGITIATKFGHDYLWVSFEKKKDAAAKKLVQKARSIYIERVYEEADFGDLLIPAL